jgi:chemotaxis protein histidine kinase CheA
MPMSDEFLRIATAEINDEISEIQNILNFCHNSLDIPANAEKIQKSTHKIKGLAPMMGKEDLGNLSSLLDSVLKKIINGAVLDEIFELLIAAVDEMKNSMIYSDYDLDEIKQRVSKISSLS